MTSVEALGPIEIRLADVAQNQDFLSGPNLELRPRHRKNLAAGAPGPAMRQNHIVDAAMVRSQNDVLDGPQLLTPFIDDFGADQIIGFLQHGTSLAHLV